MDSVVKVSSITLENGLTEKCTFRVTFQLRFLCIDDVLSVFM